MTEVRFCPACGANRFEGAQFCASCGLELGTIAASSEADQSLAPEAPSPTASLPGQPVVKSQPLAGAGVRRRWLPGILIGAAGLVVVGIAAGLMLPSLLRSVAPPPPCLRVTYQVLPNGASQSAPSDVAVIRMIIDHRLSDLAGPGYSVEAVGGHGVVVTLPCGLADPASVRVAIGQIGRLEIVPIPAGANVADGQRIDPVLHAILSGAQISSLSLATDTAGHPAVDVTLESDGAAKFAAYTEANVGSEFAFVLDGTIISAAVIRSPITDGKARITGGPTGFTPTQARDLLVVLKYGSLPFAIQETSAQSLP